MNPFDQTMNLSLSIPLVIRIPSSPSDFCSGHTSHESVSSSLSMEFTAPPPCLERWSSQGSASSSKIPPTLPKRLASNNGDGKNFCNSCGKKIRTEKRESHKQEEEKLRKVKSESALPPNMPLRYAEGPKLVSKRLEAPKLPQRSLETVCASKRFL